MGALRVLIVDDSVLFRSQIRAALESLPGIEVAGVAAHGRIALQKLRQSPVDLVTLDLVMPEMDGLATLDEIRQLPRPPRVIVFSSITRRGAATTLEALNRGAADFVTKPDGDATGSGSASDMIRGLLAEKLVELGGMPRLAPEPLPPAGRPPVPWHRREIASMRPEIIVIGSSTGGPNALERVFARLRTPPRCPILIVQHMPPIFTTMLAERLSSLSGLDVREAKQMEWILPGRVYIAPGDYHMRVHCEHDGYRIQLDQGSQRHSVRPSVDHLFESAARAFGDACAGFVLTGMGSDGQEGATAIKRAGGGIMIQDQASSVVFGMPGAVQAVGAYDRMGDIDAIQEILARIAS